jgi:hypothetical protein
MSSPDPGHYSRRREQLVDNTMQIHSDITNKSEQLETLFQIWIDRAALQTKTRFAEPVIDSLDKIKIQHSIVTDEMEQVGKRLAELEQLWSDAHSFDQQYSELTDELGAQEQESIRIQRQSEQLRQTSDETFNIAARELQDAES